MKQANHRIYKIIGKNMERIRKSKGWTINHAAKKASLSWGHLKRIEEGNCQTTVKTILKITENWQVPIVDFLKPPS